MCDLKWKCDKYSAKKKLSKRCKAHPIAGPIDCSAPTNPHTEEKVHIFMLETKREIINNTDKNGMLAA